MRNIRWATRLILLVVGVVLLAGVINVGFALHSTGKQFEDYLVKSWDNQSRKLAEVISFYYEETGSLSGIENLLELPRGGGFRRGQAYLSMRGLGGGVSIITDPSGKIIWGPDGEYGDEVINLKEESLKMPVIGRDRIIAYLLPAYKNMYEPSRTLEGQFLSSMLGSLIRGTVISVIIALVLGLLFSRSLLEPLRKLITAAREFSGGNLNYRLKNRMSDDIDEVYTAFNEMAEKLSAQEKLRRDMVADVAHELRTPLTILSGHLESMQEGIEQVSYETLTSLHDEVLHLRVLVDDLQQLTLAEARQLPLHREKTELAGFLQETLALFEIEAREKNVSLKFFATEDQFQASVDRARLRQVFINLIGNALRYVPADGEVGIEIETRDRKTRISIYDNGPGIAKEDLPFVFERFYRGDKARSRQSGGTGLGLAIAKSFVEAHDGTIEVDSSVGKGTVFRIELAAEGLNRSV